jgi:hypothetical protein
VTSVEVAIKFVSDLHTNSISFISSNHHPASDMSTPNDLENQKTRIQHAEALLTDHLTRQLQLPLGCASLFRRPWVA